MQRRIGVTAKVKLGVQLVTIARIIGIGVDDFGQGAAVERAVVCKHRRMGAQGRARGVQHGARAAAVVHIVLQARQRLDRVLQTGGKMGGAVFVRHLHARRRGGPVNPQHPDAPQRHVHDAHFGQPAARMDRVAQHRRQAKDKARPAIAQPCGMQVRTVQVHRGFSQQLAARIQAHTRRLATAQHHPAVQCPVMDAVHVAPEPQGQTLNKLSQRGNAGFSQARQNRIWPSSAPARAHRPWPSSRMSSRPWPDRPAADRPRQGGRTCQRSRQRSCRSCGRWRSR